MSDIQIVQRRWEDIREGDVVRDDRWRWQHWQKVQRIEHVEPNTVEVWCDLQHPDMPREDLPRGYRTSGLELVNVQVEVVG